MSFVDLDRERYYGHAAAKLSARTLRERKLVWELPLDLGSHRIRDAFLSGDLLLLLTGSELIAVRTKTGELAYRVKATALQLALPDGPSRYVLADIGDALYLVGQKRRFAKPDDPLWDGATQDLRPLLKRYDPRTGKLRWAQVLSFKDPEDLVRAASDGLAVGQMGGIVWFDPKTGVRRLGPYRHAYDSMVVDGTHYLLAGSVSPHLLGWGATSRRALWDVIWSDPSFRFLGAFKGLLAISNGRTIDFVRARTGRTARSTPGPGRHGQPRELRIHADRDSALLSGPAGKDKASGTGRLEARKARAISLQSRKVYWFRDDADVAALTRTEAILVVPALRTDGGQWSDINPDSPAVVSVGLKNGKVRWRWALPALPVDSCDSATIRVHRCASGYVVRRSWRAKD